MHRRWIGAMVALLPLAAAPHAEEAEPARAAEAVEILQKVDATVKEVVAVRYRMSVTPGGLAENFFGTSEGAVVMTGWSGNAPQKFVIRAKTQREGQPVEITGGGNGDSFFLIDHTAKKAYEDIDPAVMGSSANVLFGLAMAEFVHPTPFDDELNGETIELEGSESVGDEDCHKIRVVYAGGRGESVWYFSKSDYLPRRRVQKFTMPQGEGSLDRTLLELEVDPELPDSLFVLKLPQGYEQIDDFAP